MYLPWDRVDHGSYGSVGYMRPALQDVDRNRAKALIGFSLTTPFASRCGTQDLRSMFTYLWRQWIHKLRGICRRCQTPYCKPAEEAALTRDVVCSPHFYFVYE
jgi:hypothetical protein